MAFNQKHDAGLKDLKTVLTFHTDCVVGKETEGIIGVKYDMLRNFVELGFSS